MRRVWEFLKDPKNREVISWIIQILILFLLLKMDKLNFQIFGTGHYVPFVWKTFMQAPP